MNQKDWDFPEIKLHERVYDPSKESLYSYYLYKLKLCSKVDANMPDALKMKHIIKDLPSTWKVPTLISSSLTFQSLLPVLSSIDQDIK